MNLKYNINDLKHESSIVIFGAGVVGELLLYFCRRERISVVAFCDNNSKKSGKKLMDIPIISFNELRNLYPDSAVLIAVIDIADVATQLSDAGWSRIYAASEILRNFPVFDYQYSKAQDFVDYVAGNCLASHDSFMFPEKLFLRSVDLVITQRCSLKCRDCSNLMQFYKKPENFDADEICASVQLLCEHADCINEFRIIGGEPFMHREYRKITEFIGRMKNVGKIVFFTNATVIPDFSGLADDLRSKLLFIITDYGKLSRNLQGMTEMLDRDGLKYLVSKAGNWTSCSEISKYHRTMQLEQDNFDNCCAKNLITLMEGALFRCPFAANCYSLGLPERSPLDRVEITQRDSLKAEIISFIRNKKVIPVCSWCPGRRFDDREIMPAIQTETPLPLPWN
ncbi:MAG: radical SAM protein [Lentisphaeria bacterium]|nr:radical SAM protein [Lentisphaeria bacterium]